MNSDSSGRGQRAPSSTGATGRWAVRSASATVYYVDLDRRLVLRRPGPGSSRGPGDDRWVRLVQLDVLVLDALGQVTLRPTATITVGRRHHYLLDPDPTGGAYQWWIQRTVTRLERLDDPAPSDAGAAPREPA